MHSKRRSDIAHRQWHWTQAVAPYSAVEYEILDSFTLSLQEEHGGQFFRESRMLL